MTHQKFQIETIVSGGQTGVDRAALDVAIFLEIEHGGWCPQGRRSESGPIPECYRLRETESAEYSPRTTANVMDSDGTLILHDGPVSGGTGLTISVARKQKRPLLLVDLRARRARVRDVQLWLQQYGIRTLNVAGPRESSSPGIGKQAEQFLMEVLAPERIHPAPGNCQAEQSI